MTSIITNPPSRPQIQYQDDDEENLNLHQDHHQQLHGRTVLADETQYDDDDDDDYEFDYFKRYHPKRQKTFSKIASNIGPHLPSSLHRTLARDGVTHLNLHANSIQSLNIFLVDCRKHHNQHDDEKPHINSYGDVHEDKLHDNVKIRMGKDDDGLCLDLLEEIDISSNHLGIYHNNVNHDNNRSKKNSVDNNDSISKTISSSVPLLLQKNPVSILSIAPNLLSLNLSANNLTNKSLQTLITTSSSSHHIQKDNIIVLQNLNTFNLSNNDLTQIPVEISKVCPNIVNLNLLNNDIQNMTNLEQLSNCHSLQCINLESNPLCLRDKLYREKIICFLGPTLRRCDGNITNNNNGHNKCNQNDDDDFNYQSKVIDESRRYEAKAKLVSELELGDEKLHRSSDNRDNRNSRNGNTQSSTTATHKSSTMPLQQKTKTSSTRSSQSNTNRTSNKKNRRDNRDDSTNLSRNKDQSITNHDKQISQDKRLKNTVETMSLHKLNSLETQVQKLSKLTLKQVEATNQLLDSQNQQQQQQRLLEDEIRQSSDVCVNNDNCKQNKVPIVCEANIQTTVVYDNCHGGGISPIPSPPSKGNNIHKNDNNTKEIDMNKLSLECILLKWYVSILKHRLNERKNQGEKCDMKQDTKEVTKTKVIECASCNTQNDIEQIYNNEIKKRNDTIVQLENELLQSKQKINQKEAEFLQYKKESVLEIEHIRSEATEAAIRNHNNHFNTQKKDRDDYYDKKMREAQLYHDNEIKTLQSSLTDTKKTMKQMQKKLEKSNLVIRDNELDKINYIEKMKQSKKAIEIMTKRSANEKVKLDYTKAATQEALRLARDRLEEMNNLKKELKDEKEKLNDTKVEHRSVKNQIISLENLLEENKVKEEELKLVLQKNDKLIIKYHDDIVDLRNKVQYEQSKQKDTMEKMMNIKKDHMNVKKKATSLKEEVLAMSHKLKKTEEVEEMRQSLCNKILQLKNSKKEYKREIQRFKYVVKDLSDDVETKKSMIASMTMEMENIMINYENTQCKVRTDYDYRYHAMKGKYDVELSLYQEKVSMLERELDKVSSEKNNAEAAVNSQMAKVDTERQKRLLIEKRFEAVKQSFDDQTKKTQEAFDSLSNQG